jgi:hypothetical protein
LLQVVTLAFIDSSGKATRGPLALGQSNTNSKLFAHTAAAGRPTASSRRRAGNLVDRDSGLNISLFTVIDSARFQGRLSGFDAWVVHEVGWQRLKPRDISYSWYASGRGKDNVRLVCEHLDVESGPLLQGRACGILKALGTHVSVPCIPLGWPAVCTLSPISSWKSKLPL